MSFPTSSPKYKLKIVFSAFKLNKIEHLVFLIENYSILSK